MTLGISPQSSGNGESISNKHARERSLLVFLIYIYFNDVIEALNMCVSHDLIDSPAYEVVT